jgi:hypothetical protein
MSQTGFLDGGYDTLNLLPLAVRRSVMVDGPKVKAAVPQVVQDLARALSAPKRAMRGDFDPNSPQGVEEANNLGLGLLGVGLARGGKQPAGQLNILIGESAKTADKKALAAAKQMAASGAPREAIHKATGWWQGPDGKWRFEIDDSQAAFRGEFGSMRPRIGEQGDMPLGAVFNHADLYRAYPDILSKVRTDVKQLPDWMPSAATRGMMQPQSRSGHARIDVRAQGEERAREILLHELQHWVQDREKFSPGGTPGDAKSALQQAVPEEVAKKLALSTYKKLRGETEARTVEERAAMSPYERRQRPFWLDYDVPEALQTEGYQIGLMGMPLDTSILRPSPPKQK